MIMDNKKALIDGIGRIPGLAVLEPSELSIFVTRSADPALDIGAVSDAMGTRGWLIGRQVEPPGIHMHLNPSHERMVARLSGRPRLGGGRGTAIAAPGPARPARLTEPAISTVRPVNPGSFRR